MAYYEGTSRTVKMKQDEFVSILEQLRTIIHELAVGSDLNRLNPIEIEEKVGEEFAKLLPYEPVEPLQVSKSQFPDFVFERFGIEVKVTKKDAWTSTANSVFESQRKKGVDHVYVLFIKLGGDLGVRFKKYDDVICHVRISHAPRFNINMDSSQGFEALFDLSYKDFRDLSDKEKFEVIKKYAIDKAGGESSLWWIGDSSAHDDDASLDLSIRLFKNLSSEEKRIARCECYWLFPEIFLGSRVRDKYDRVSLYLISFRGILASNTRDMFSAGSVGNKGNLPGQAGSYRLNALLDVANMFQKVYNEIPDEAFIRYWGHKSSDSEAMLLEWKRKMNEIIGPEFLTFSDVF